MVRNKSKIGLSSSLTNAVYEKFAVFNTMSIVDAIITTLYDLYDAGSFTEVGINTLVSDSDSVKMSMKSNKPRKARTAFTDHQLSCLEKSFEQHKYLIVQDRMDLAAKLFLTDTHVKTWYQNRRRVYTTVGDYMIFIFVILNGNYIYHVIDNNY